MKPIYTCSMDLIDDGVIPEDKIPYGYDPMGWDDEGNLEDSEEYYEDSVNFECYK